MYAIAPKFVGKIWPTGKFGVSRLREIPFLSQFKSQPETDETQWNSARVSAHGAESVLRYEGKWESVCDPDLSNVPKSPIRKKRGQQGITRHGRNLISSAAVVVEKRYDKNLLTFGTVTLPAGERDHLLAVSRNWSIVVKEFVKNLRRGLKAKALPSFVFGVTEIQEKRLARFGVPALHLHFVFVGRNSKKSSWQVDRKNIRRWWKKAIAPYFPADTDFSSVENVQQVKKSAASYLGKYMSKGASAIAQLVEQGYEEWIPSAWYTISHELRRDVLSKVIRGEECGAFLIWLAHNVMQDWVNWIAPVLIKRSDGSNYAIGYAGSLSRRGLDSAANILVRCRTTAP